MTIFQVSNAYAALNKLMALDLPYSKTLALLHIKKDLETDAQFYTMEESKLIDRYVAKDKTGRPIIKNGYPEYTTQSDREALNQKGDQLRNMESKINTISVSLTEQEIENQKISGQVIEALKGIVQFGGL